MPRAPRNSASVLVTILWVLVFVSMIAATVARTARVEVEAAGREVDRVRTRAIAESGLVWAIAELEAIGRSTSSAQWRDDPDTWRAVEFGGGTFSLHYLDLTARERKWGIYEEASKLNLNTASTEQIAAIFEVVLEDAPVSYAYSGKAFAAAIADFRDDDSEALDLGAEGPDYYQTLDPPYEPKNGPFESLAELLLVRGVDERLLWGEDTNGNGRVDGSEKDGLDRYPPDDGDGTLAPGLAHFFTIYAYEPNQAADGKDRVDLNQASDEDLTLALAGFVANDRIEALLRYRRRGFSSVGDLVQVSGWTIEDVQAVVDFVTIVSESRLVGRVDVATAPPEVLALVPGLDDEKAAAIVEYRSSRTDTLDTIGWLLDVVDTSTFRSVAESVTSRAWQYELRVYGEIGDGAAFTRLTAIVDLADSSAGPRFLHYSDDTALGPLAKVEEWEEGS